MLKKYIFICFLIIMSFVVFSVSMTTEIKGRVSLRDGNAIPGVLVVLSCKNIPGLQFVVTGENGDFRFDNLSAGVYQIKFESEGFQTQVQKNIQLLRGKKLNLNILLDFSSQSQTAPISARS